MLEKKKIVLRRLTPIAKVLQKEIPGQDINNYKAFYNAFLLNVKDRNEVLRIFKSSYLKLEELGPLGILFEKEKNSTNRQIENLLEQFVGQHFAETYKKELDLPGKQTVSDDDLPFLQSFLIALAKSSTSLIKTQELRWQYRIRLLKYAYDCLLQFGLHPNIWYRGVDFKRYNVLITHNFHTKPKPTDITMKILISGNQLAPILSAYRQKAPIQIEGKLIPLRNVIETKISTTLLLNDEIYLFGLKKGFEWSTSFKDTISFINSCKNETDELLDNPYLEENSLSTEKKNFIDPTRLKELKTIQKTKYDLAKVVQICTTLNKAYKNNDPLSVSANSRALIDHIPPVFGFETFAKFANGYAFSSKSLKSGMLKLETSLRGIAGNNLHSPIDSRIVLPNMTQVSFVQEIDWLLSEVIRVCK